MTSNAPFDTDDCPTMYGTIQILHLQSSAQTTAHIEQWFIAALFLLQQIVQIFGTDKRIHANAKIDIDRLAGHQRVQIDWHSSLWNIINVDLRMAAFFVRLVHVYSDFQIALQLTQYESECWLIQKWKTHW